MQFSSNPDSPPFLQPDSQLAKEDPEDNEATQGSPFGLGLSPAEQEAVRKRAHDATQQRLQAVMRAHASNRAPRRPSLPPHPKPSVPQASSSPATAAAAANAPGAAKPAEQPSGAIRSRLKQCGLSEELIDLMRPTISREQMTSLFAYHDASGTGTLSPAESRELATWLYGRVPILFRDMMKQANPEKSMRELDAMLMEHLPHIMPGTSEDITAYLLDSLPWSDGRVSREEFVRVWNRHARLLFPSSHHRTTHKGTVYCTIL